MSTYNAAVVEDNKEEEKAPIAVKVSEVAAEDNETAPSIHAQSGAPDDKCNNAQVIFT